MSDGQARSFSKFDKVNREKLENHTYLTPHPAYCDVTIIYNAVRRPFVTGKLKYFLLFTFIVSVCYCFVTVILQFYFFSEIFILYRGRNRKFNVNNYTEIDLKKNRDKRFDYQLLQID